MKIAIIGAGFGGMAAAYDLRKAGHEVTVLEAADYVGGLASGQSATVTVDVYPPTGGTINGGTTTTGQRGVATQTGATFVCVSTDGLTWVVDNSIAAAS